MTPARAQAPAGNDSLAEVLDDRATGLFGLLPELAAAAAVLAVFVVIGWLVGRALGAALSRGGARVHTGFVTRLPKWLFGFAGVLVALDYLGLDGVATGLLAGGGATAIIVGFAFREIGENFLAGLFLAFSRPFRLGDLIRSGDLPEGEVRAVHLRNTQIRTADGRDIYIPNGRMFNEPLVNFTRDGLRRPTFTLGVDYRDPIPQVRTTLRTAVAAVDGVLDHPEPRVEIVDLSAAFVLLEVQVWINTFSGTDFASVQSATMEACRRTILENGWTISSEVTSVLEFRRRPG